MHHGLCNDICTLWPVGCTTYRSPMYHGLYNRIFTPWPMSCTAGFPHHGPWVVQQYIHPMVHGLYNTSENANFSCSMGCTTGSLPADHDQPTESHTTKRINSPQTIWWDLSQVKIKHSITMNKPTHPTNHWSCHGGNLPTSGPPSQFPVGVLTRRIVYKTNKQL